jgi:hypothetical protein
MCIYEDNNDEAQQTLSEKEPGTGRGLGNKIEGELVQSTLYTPVGLLQRILFVLLMYANKK